jgi:hypothetical protein
MNDHGLQTLQDGNTIEEFIASLIEQEARKSGFLDRCETHCVLHNWRIRNPYAYFREERSEVARKAAETHGINETS